jgi:hypothetical protein
MPSAKEDVLDDELAEADVDVDAELGEGGKKRAPREG